MFGCCIFPCCYRSDPFEKDPFAQPVAPGANAMYQGLWTNPSQLYQSMDVAEPKAGGPELVIIDQFQNLTREEFSASFERSKEVWESRDITVITALEADFLSRLYPDFVLVRLAAIKKENPLNKPDEKFLENISPKAARKLILLGAEMDLNDKDKSPGIFLRSNSPASRLILAYLSNQLSKRHQELIRQFIQGIADQVESEKVDEMTEKRIAAIKFHVVDLMQLLSHLADSLDTDIKKLLSKIKVLIDTTGESRPEYQNMGAILSFGQFTLRYLNPLITNLGKSMPEAEMFNTHKAKNANRIAAILQYLNANLSEEDLLRKNSKPEDRYIVDLVLEFQEEYNAIRDRVFEVKAL